MTALATRLTRPRAAAIASRLYAALPVLTIFAWLCLIFGWEAWGNLSPWLFGDELEKTQLARAIAETGHAARRGVPVTSHSLVAWLTAPAWLVHDTTRAYGLLKAMQVAAMTSVIFPTYLLARQLVSPRWALFAAVGAATIPALSYSSLILEEPFAYPYSALCFFLIVKSLATQRRHWIAAAVVASLVAPFVRGELAVIPATFVVAALVFVWSGERARRWRSGWSAWDWTGWLLLLAGVVIVVNAVIRSHSQEWEISTEFEKHRMIVLGLQAAGALTIGLGLLPVVAGLAFILPLARERRDPVLRAFFASAVTAIVGFGFYTAVKAAWNAIQFSTIVAERNLIYLSPLLFVATAALLERRLRAPLAVIAGASAFVLYLVLTTPYKMEFHFYFDAPGLSILQSANRVLAFTPHDAKVALIVLVVLATAVLLLTRLVRNERALGWALGGSAAFVLAWTLTGEITGARSSHEFADALLANLPRPLDWIDRADHGRPAIYLGQHITDANAVFLTEFWNRSIVHVWSNDGSAPGPGPTLTPDIVKPNGTLFPQPKEEYMVTDSGLEIVGSLILERSHNAGGVQVPLRLYRITPPLRMRQSIEGLFADGWGQPHTAYNQYSTPDRRPGYVVVDVSRAGGGKTIPATAKVLIGKLAINKHHQPHLGRILARRSVYAASDLEHRFVIPAPPAPFRVETEVTPFSPHDLNPTDTDVRTLGAQISYGFVPKTPQPIPGKPPDVTGVYYDGWIGPEATYTQWSAPFEQPGTVRVTVSRRYWAGTDIPGHVRIVVGKVGYRKVGPDLRFGITQVTATRTWTVHAKQMRTLSLPTPKPPFRVEIRISPLFVPAKLDPRSTDRRQLGAQVAFRFVPF